MRSFDFDLVTIGGGSGGVRASRMAAAFGARVALAEASRLGGTCVNLGCIPKKLLFHASRYGEQLADAAAFGWSLGPARFDWATLVANRDRKIARLNQGYAGLLDGAGVVRLEGRARLLDAHRVEVAGRRFTAAQVLIATGSRPSLPALPGIEHAITSDQAFQLPALPARLAIVGGGYIAVEFAGIFHGLGARVTQLHRGERLLRGFDDDVRLHLAAEMRRKGIDVRFGAQVERLDRTPTGVRVSLAGGETLRVDAVLYATGRVPNTAGLGLEALGVELGPAGEIRVDELSRSSLPGVWAIGDVTDRLNLTPVALHEGACFARTVFGGRPTRPDHELVPTAVFSQPAIGSVGWTEAEARARFGAVDVYRERFRPLHDRMTGRGEETLVKLVVDARSDRVLGCHLVGPEAPEILQGFAVALRLGATKAQLDATVGIHPTTAEELVTLRERAAA
jgi:glutathione reductase (NADPH)